MAERAKTLMELNKNLQAEKSEPGGVRKRRAAVARNGRAKTGQRRTYRRFLRRKRRQTSGEKSRKRIERKFSKRLGKIQTIASVLVLATFRRVQFVRCDQTLVVEHVLKMREKNGLSNTGER